MRRRTFISVLGVIAVTCSALAQNPRQRRVGVLMQGGGAHLAGLEGLRLRLKESGLEVILDVRDGRGNLGVIAAAASDLEREGVEVIVAFSASVAMTTKSATHHVPIVFASGSDPVAFGLVQTINRPGGRLTGVHSVMADVTGKRLELLRQLLPRLDRVVTFYNPKNPVAMSALTAARAAANALAVEVVAEEVATPNEIRERLLKLRDVKADAFFFVNDSMVQSQDKLIIDEATRLGMASMAYELQLVSSGALAGYGLNYSEFGLLAAKYVGAILQGANASDLPVEATAPQFAINLRTARALGLSIPPTLLARADEVIE